jgi:predicted DNA-binding transcriptional regulator AlpA
MNDTIHDPKLAPLLIREKDLPALLGLSRATIRRAMAAGRFPQCLRIGRCVAWRRADVDRWLANGCPAVEGDGK